MRSRSLVLPNDLPENIRGAYTRCAVVVRVREARMGVMQERAAEIGILAAERSGARRASGAK